ncbi:MAG TPA: extracellular solute-binding protein [Acidiferrobacterales bacterium]|nr:extracellular solute-binding protein [Acidiferrobacterales bacterium]
MRDKLRMARFFSLQKGVCGFLIALLVGCLMTACEKGEEKTANREIFLYQGADREQKLVANAKQEGVVNLYISMQQTDSGPIIGAFEKKYGIKINSWRASPEKVVQRAVIEARAGRYDVDVLEMNGPEMEMVYRENLLEQFYSPAFKDIPPAAFPKHKYYAPDRINLFVIAYNTKLVKPDDAPNSYEDLLNPKWKGKFVMEPSDVDWFAAVVKGMGEQKGLDYFKKLAAMGVTIREGHTILAEITASGEFPFALNVYNHAVEKLKQKDATVEWKPLQPAFGRVGGIGIARNTAHPYAALLFTEFVISKDGQQLIRDRGRVPVSLAVDSPLNKFNYELIDPAIVLDEWDKWAKLWSDLFLGGKAVKKEEEK